MRHLRFLASLLLFVALPAFLAWRGFGLYADFVTRAHHDEAFARQGRILRELKDEINLGLEKERLGAAVIRELSNLPSLDDAAVAAVKGSFETRFPGLLRIVVFRREGAPGGKARLVAVDQAGMPKRTLVAAFAEFLYRIQADRENYGVTGERPRTVELDTERDKDRECEKPRAKAMRKMVERELVGTRISLEYIVEQRGHAINLTHAKHDVGFYWDLLTRPGPGAGPGGRRGMAFVYLDEARYDAIFNATYFTARKNLEVNDPALRIELFRDLTSEAALQPFVAAEPALAGKLRPTLGTALEVEGASRLVTWLPARDADGLFLVASTEKDALVAGILRTRGILRALILLVALAATLAGVLVHTGRFRPYVSVRLQLAGLFGLASLLPLSVIFYMGLHYVRASEEVAAKRTTEDLRQRILTIDEEERRIRGDLQAAAVRLLESRECLDLGDALARCEGRGSAEVRAGVTGEVQAFVRAITAQMGTEKIFAYWLCGPGGDILAKFRHDHEEHVKRVGAKFGMLQNRSTYYDEDGFISGMARAGIARFSGVEDPDIGPDESKDSISSFFLRNQMGLADRLFRIRRVIHSFDLFGHRVDMFFEPIVDRQGTVRGTLGFFYVSMFLHYHRIRRAVESMAASPDGVRLYAGHDRYKINRHPSPEAFTGDLLAAFEKVAAERNPVEAHTRVNGEEVLLVAQHLSNFRDYVLVATSPYAKVREEVARTLRLISTLLALSVVLAAAIGLVIAVKFIAPVRAFERGVAALTLGELDFRMAVDSNDELGELAGAFNRMISGLQEKERMSRYVSESVRGAVKRADGQGHDLGELRKATILFADIRGFTNLSERHLPSEIVAMLNGYLDAMTGVIIRNGGMVDKFIGDAIMAVFHPDPAPGARSDEARAVVCALEMRAALEAFNADRATQGLFTVDIGIGIHTDEVIHGSIGSREHRVDLTVIGDGVNLAARLESLSKEGRHTKIVISGRTLEAVRDLVDVEPMGEREVRGKAKAVALFEIVGAKRAADHLPALADPDPARRVEAIRLLAVLGDPAALPGITGALADSEPAVRREAINALRKTGRGERAAIDAARVALERERDESVRSALIALVGSPSSPISPTPTRASAPIRSRRCAAAAIRRASPSSSGASSPTRTTASARTPA